jgi:hypothetical protein
METSLTKVCALSLVAGAPERCPLDACAFWQPDGDDLESGCAVERLELHLLGEDVASFLLAVRDA